MIKIGFVILTWNSENYISYCLNSIRNTGSYFSHVVVVDNGSTDSTIDLVTTFTEYASDSFKCELLRLETNCGTTVSRNKGIKLLQKTENINYYCILDSDTEVNEESIKTLVSYLQRNPSIGIIGPRMHDSNGFYQVSGRSFPTLTEKILKILPFEKATEKGEMLQNIIKKNGTGCAPVGYLMSACWLMPNSTIDRVGYLDEKIFYAPEDVDYCIRSWKAGLSVVYCYDADILHHWQRLSRKKIFSKHNFEHLKGLLYMFRKHHYIFSAEKLNAIIDEFKYTHR